MIKLKYCFLCIVLLCLRCSDVASPQLGEPSKLWSARIAADNKLTGSIKPIINDDLVIITQWGIHLPSEKMLAFDKHSGVLRWEWNEHLDGIGTFLFVRNTHVYNDVLIISTTKGIVYAIDLEKGQTVWYSDGPFDFSKDISGIDEYVLNVQRNGDGSTLLMSTIYAGNWSAVVSYSTENNWIPRIMTPRLLRNTPNELVAIFWLNWYDPTTRHVKPYIVSYNITTQEKEFETLLTSSLNARAGVHEIPNVYESKIFVVLDDELICLDLYTGEILWRNRFSNSILGGDTFAHDHFVVAVPEDQYIYSFDIQNGSQRWKKYIGGGTNVIAYHDGILYLVSSGNHHLYAIDKSSGKEYWDFESPLKHSINGAFFNDYIAVDSQSERIFIMNYVDLECYALIAN